MQTDKLGSQLVTFFLFLMDETQKYLVLISHRASVVVATSNVAAQYEETGKQPPT